MRISRLPCGSSTRKVGAVDDLTTALKLYCRIWRGHEEPDQTTPVHIQLKLSGIVKRNDYGHLVVRNKIYHLIFTAQWAAKTISAKHATLNLRVGGAVDFRRHVYLDPALGR